MGVNPTQGRCCISPMLWLMPLEEILGRRQSLRSLADAGDKPEYLPVFCRVDYAAHVVPRTTGVNRCEGKQHTCRQGGMYDFVCNERLRVDCRRFFVVVAVFLLMKLLIGAGIKAKIKKKGDQQ